MERAAWKRGHLAAAGWRVAVRADFDAAGLGHVDAFLSAMPDTVPWRMSTADYLEGVSSEPAAATVDRLPETKWDSAPRRDDARA